MYIKSRFIDESRFEKTFPNELKNINFSFFFDCIPSFEELNINPINIFVHEEPNEYFGHHDWIIQNQNYFSIILTWSDKVLNNCNNAIFLPFGHTWFKKEQYEKNHNKKFQISHLRGNLLKTYGHSLRHELLDRENEIKIPKKFFASYGDRYNIEEARKGKEEVFSDSMYGVAIENTSHNGYFTEKILDCFLLKTIPVYWGCSSIFNFFRQDGIIIFSNIDDLIVKVNNLTETYYFSNMEAIEANYNLALQYVDYEQNITYKVIEILKYNNLI